MDITKEGKDEAKQKDQLFFNAVSLLFKLK